FYDEVTLFLKAGGDPNLQDAWGRTPFWYYFDPEDFEGDGWFEAEYADLLRVFLEHGADPNIPDHRRHTPMMQCARRCGWRLDEIRPIWPKIDLNSACLDGRLDDVLRILKEDPEAVNHAFRPDCLIYDAMQLSYSNEQVQGVI